MPKAFLKDGNFVEFSQNEEASVVIGRISQGLLRNTLAVGIDGKVSDLNTPLVKDCKLIAYTFSDEEGKKAFWHTGSHILAQAVKRLYPKTKLAIGPAIDNGFYYDFDSEISFTPEHLEKIEGEMKKIVAENLPLTRKSVSREEALKIFADEPYKTELITELPENEEITLYTQGEFTDLCAGPHILSTSLVKAFKLTQATGAYWRGRSDSKMLQRIYGTAFLKQSELTEYLAAVEEAKRRDHNKIGRELCYFTTVDYIGQGLPIIMPKGAKVIQTLQRFVEDEEEKRGYMLTKTPFMAKNDLFKISGHWDHYRDGMFVLGDEEKDEEVYALRPMTCPFQFQVYLNKMRSYRDLPMRFNETSTLFRNEASGEMHGLIRVRQFTISEGHIACTPAQLENEFRSCVDLANFMLKAVGLDGDVSYRFSKWDESNKEKYIGEPSQWEEVQNRMKAILDNMGLDYKTGEGEAAFYGPKLDIQIKNVHGKEDTLITVQIDFLLAERFMMEYVDTDGSKKHPYVIHRTSIGCYERTLALLIEKYAGALPLWLMPTQVAILPIGERQHEYAYTVLEKLQRKGIRCDIDIRNEKIGYKIREQQIEKTPYMLVLGDKETESNMVAVRSRKGGDLGVMAIDEFALMVEKKILDRENNE